MNQCEGCKFAPQVRGLTPRPGSTQPPSLFSAMRQVVQQEGLMSLWKGNLATIIHRGDCWNNASLGWTAALLNEQLWFAQDAQEELQKMVLLMNWLAIFHPRSSLLCRQLCNL